MTCWVGVVSRDHVVRAVAGGFCQFSHGEEAPVKRIARGDHIVYYSPRETMGAGNKVQAFTAIGRVDDDEPYQARSSGDFEPFRRRVAYFDAHEAPIAPLLDRLTLIGGRSSWGQVFRRGFFRIDDHDYATIAHAMGAGTPKA